MRTAGGASTHYSRYSRDPAGWIVAERTPSGRRTTTSSSATCSPTPPPAPSCARYGYGPYRDEVTSPGPNAEVYTDNPWRFAGGESDGNTLYHFGARYYNTAGQWAAGQLPRASSPSPTAPTATLRRRQPDYEHRPERPRHRERAPCVGRSIRIHRWCRAAWRVTGAFRCRRLRRAWNRACRRINTDRRGPTPRWGRRHWLPGYLTYLATE